MTVVPVDGAGVLIARRARRAQVHGRPAGDRWLGLPSGFVEFGERWQDSAAGEVAEETGIRLDTDRAASALGRRRHVAGLRKRPASVACGNATVHPSLDVSRAPDPEVVFPLDSELLAEWIFRHGPPASASPG